MGYGVGEFSIRILGEQHFLSYEVVGQNPFASSPCVQMLTTQLALIFNQIKMSRLQLFSIFLLFFIIALGIVGGIFVRQLSTFVPRATILGKETFDAKLYENNRVDCVNQKAFCFTDSDCANQCLYNVNYACLHGICKHQVLFSTDADVECNPHMGMLAFFQGDPTFGRYEFACKSIDPDIAISTEENRMCFGGSINIDYREKLPAIADCTCPKSSDMVVVPATRNKRRHVECQPGLEGLVKYQ